MLLPASPGSSELLRNSVTLIDTIVKSHLLIHVCWLLLAFIVAVLLISDPLGGTVHNILSLLNLALDQALDSARSKVLVLVLPSGSGPTRYRFHTEVNHCSTNLNCLVVAWNQRSTLSN